MKLKDFDFNSIRRIALYIAIALIAGLLWNTWVKEHQQVNPPQTAPSTTQATTFVPPSFSGKTATTSQTVEAVSKPNSSDLISFKTDVLAVTVDLQGGNLSSVQLLKYDESLNKPHTPVTILTADPDYLYLAQDGLKKNGALTIENIHFTAVQKDYTLELKGQTSSGLQVTKKFLFEPGKYNIQVITELHNAANTPWVGNVYQQLVRRDLPKQREQHSRSYDGAAISSSDRPYEKLPFKKLREESLHRDIQGGWVAMQQAYFLSAWIPAKDQYNHYYSSVSDNVYTVGYVGPLLTLAHGAGITQQTQFYVGPEITDYLKPLAKGLDLTIDYGWLWMISKAIFWVMDHVHNVVGNWGWSIIITTLIIKVLFYKLSEKSYRSMAKMRDIQPRLQALKERFGDDKQGLGKATMDFYKTEKINPLGGCLPTVIQIPVFIALYYVLIESVQLRQAPFILWIRDLSIHDPYYILPILMGVSMFFQQRLSPPPPDPTQAKMMMFLPVIFTVFFLSFPAGLVLYWLVNNCATILQQWYVMKTYKPAKHNSKKKKFKK
jgi:YidC/Oxa1 family membrane protein insertase